MRLLSFVKQGYLHIPIINTKRKKGLIELCSVSAYLCVDVSLPTDITPEESLENITCTLKAFYFRL